MPWNGSRALKAQNIMKEYGIHFDSAANGVFLPMEKNIHVTTEAMHVGNHGPDYVNYVNQTLSKVKNAGVSKDDIIAALNKMRLELLNGSLKLN